MAAIDTAIRDLEQIQMMLVRMHGLLAREPFSMTDRHRVDGYFDAFASDIAGLEEYLRGMSSTTAAS